MLPVFRTENPPLQIYFLELHLEILMQQLLNIKTKKYVVGQSFFMSKNYFIKKGFWSQSCKMTGCEGAWADYTFKCIPVKLSLLLTCHLDTQ